MSHYFSRVRPLRVGGKSEFARSLRQGEAYRDHMLVWELFPGDGKDRDFLFRAERIDGHEVVYYVVSQRMPQADPMRFAVQTEPYAPVLRAGETVRFDLRANPTVSRRIDQRRSRRHDVLMDAKRGALAKGERPDVHAAGLAWLLERSAAWGLEIDPDHVVQSGYRQHRLRPEGRTIEFSSLDYQGAARVADPAALQRAMLTGVGHAKGFGCGLLLVKRF